MRVAIVGSRDFDWADIAKNGKVLDGYSKENVHTKGMREMIRSLVGAMQTKDQVVSGAADGADYWAEAFAHILKRGRDIHEADWNRQIDGSYDRSAGPKRNALIVKDADVVFAFMTDRTTSRGTLNCLKQAGEKGITAYIWDAKTMLWSTWDSRNIPMGSTFGGQTIDYKNVIEVHRNQVNQPVEQRDEGRPFTHSYDMYGHQPGCSCWNGILGGGLGRS